jgi:hypothetical protein
MTTDAGRPKHRLSPPLSPASSGEGEDYRRTASYRLVPGGTAWYRINFFLWTKKGRAMLLPSEESGSPGGSPYRSKTNRRKWLISRVSDAGNWFEAIGAGPLGAA